MTYILIRIVEEKYEITAKNLKEAKQLARTKDNPYAVRVVRETVKAQM
jgi:ribosomal protein L31E